MMPSEIRAISPSSFSLASLPRVPRMFFIAPCKSFTSRSGLSATTSAAGVMSTRLTVSTRRWVSVLKVEIVSISSPQNSTRKGSGMWGGKKSRMPPRWENWQTPSTWSQRV